MIGIGTSPYSLGLPSAPAFASTAAPGSEAMAPFTSMSSWTAALSSPDVPDAGPPAPLEPVDPIPVAEGADLGLGAQLLAGGLGALVGAGIAKGVAPQLRGSILVGAAIGAIALNRVADLVFGSVSERQERARIRTEYGTSTLELAEALISQYDQDGDGVITGPTEYGRIAETSIATRRRAASVTVHDMEATWRRADAIVIDGQVDATELATLMATFDADRSGSLTTEEHVAFQQSHAPVATRTTP